MHPLRHAVSILLRLATTFRLRQVIPRRRRAAIHFGLMPLRVRTIATLRAHRSGTARSLCVLLVALAASDALIAQVTPVVPSAAGREFWIAFQKNFRDFVTNERTMVQTPAAPLMLTVTAAVSSISISTISMANERPTKRNRISGVFMNRVSTTSL